jgi:hypothetical protein
MSAIEEEPKECIVCFEVITKELGFVDIKCGHVYCAGCFAKHMRTDNKCAMCRVVIFNVPSIEEKPSIIEEDQHERHAMNEIADHLTNVYMSPRLLMRNDLTLYNGLFGPVNQENTFSDFVLNDANALFPDFFLSIHNQTVYDDNTNING